VAEPESVSQPRRSSAVADIVRNLFWVAVAGVVLVFAFFAALGAIDPGSSGTAWLVAGALAVLWAVHAWTEHHRAEKLRAAHRMDRELVRARERRGF
jgi:hypothetical protein